MQQKLFAASDESNATPTVELISTLKNRNDRERRGCRQAAFTTHRRSRSGDLVGRLRSYPLPGVNAIIFRGAFTKGAALSQKALFPVARAARW